MSKAKVLIIDDEEAIRRFLRLALTSQDYGITEAASGQEGLSKALIDKPDILILDLGLPDIDGVEVVHRLREWTKTPIIILSVRGSESDKIAALDAGADDYLTKPFGVGELLARLRAALRHAGQASIEPVMAFGELSVDLAQRLVVSGGRPLQLTPNEYELLRVLVTHAGRVLTHRHLLNAVWGPQYGQESHMLQVNINNLRRKIEPVPARPCHIITEPGVGYRLATD